MTKPLLFVSHKHDDAVIAERVAEFVRTVTGGQVDVYLSSSPDFEGPRIGKPLSKELRDALWRAGVVILVYTSQDKDWAWCMWECGLADESSSPDTKVVVLQCFEDIPSVFDDGVRVLAWERDSLISLSYRFRQADFFPRAGGKVTGLKEGELKKRAKKLHEDLGELITREPTENWSAWPFLRLEIPRKKIKAIHAAAGRKAVNATVDMLVDYASVVDSGSGLPGLYGRVEVANGTAFGVLVDEWREAFPGREPTWLSSLGTQVLEASRKRRPGVKVWGRLRAVGGGDEFVLGVGRVKRDAISEHYDCYFFGLGPVASVEDRMTRRDKMYYIDLAKRPAAEVVLVNELDDLEERDWSRVPVLDGDQPKYIIHVSMVDRFLRLSALEGADVSQLTLKDILDNKEMQRMFASTFSTVEKNATIADALVRMRDIPNCEDVFVCDEGGVVGWLTNRDIPIDALRSL